MSHSNKWLREEDMQTASLELLVVSDAQEAKASY